MILKTFVLTHKGKVISPPLVTIRCYGEWMKEVFDEYTVKLELYMKTRDPGLNGRALEWHPGSRIGAWYDHNTFTNKDLECWYFDKECYASQRLIKLGLADRKDMVSSKTGFRVYTVKQVELYIRSNIDKSFDISKYVEEPIQVAIKGMDGITQPKYKVANNKLF